MRLLRMRELVALADGGVILDGVCESPAVFDVIMFVITEARP
jgi:hypothetical protein